MSKLSILRLHNAACLSVAASLFAGQALAVNVTVNADVEKFEISPYITASSQVHVWGKDSILTNAAIDLTGCYADVCQIGNFTKNFSSDSSCLS